MRALTRALRLLERLRDGLCITGLVALVALVAVQVFFRYIMGSPLTWPEEVARYVYVWVAFLAVAKLAGERQLYAIDFLISRAGATIRQIVDVLITLATIAFFAIALNSAWSVLAANVRIRMSTGIPVNFLYASLPVAAVLIILALLPRLFEQMRALTDKRRADQGPSDAP